MRGPPKAVLGINKKCIVLDLDNTLWGGIVGEDGFEGIELGPKPPGIAFVEFQRHALCQRGVILAINSKNNPDDALMVLRYHPYMVLREENFAVLMINWNDKVCNMKEIAEELNIGLDSIVYFDDDPINREIMVKALRWISQKIRHYMLLLMHMNDFNVLKITED